MSLYDSFMTFGRLQYLFCMDGQPRWLCMQTVICITGHAQLSLSCTPNLATLTQAVAPYPFVAANLCCI